MEYKLDIKVNPAHWGKYNLRLSVGRAGSVHIGASPDDMIHVSFSLDHPDLKILFTSQLYENLTELDLRIKKHRNATKASLSPKLALDILIPFDAMNTVGLFAVGEVTIDDGLDIVMLAE